MLWPVGAQVNDQESADCAKAAIEAGFVYRVIHWVQRSRLASTEGLGALFVQFSDEAAANEARGVSGRERVAFPAGSGIPHLYFGVVGLAGRT